MADEIAAFVRRSVICRGQSLEELRGCKGEVQVLRISDREGCDADQIAAIIE